MIEAIEAVRGGFVALSTGRARVPLRGVLDLAGSATLTMPAHVEGSPISCVKVVSVYPANQEKGIPTINAAVLVVDADTGVPLALLEGASVTALRTGAASGLATELLARPDAATLAILGAGVQARTQAEAVCAVRPIAEIRVYSPNTAAAFADELRQRYEARVIVAASAHIAMEGADVVVAATTSRTPVIYARDLSPGAHVNAVGSFQPHVQEIAADVMISARVVLDHRESAWAESGDLIIPRDQGLLSESPPMPELGEVAAGLVEGRRSPEEVVLFKSVGNAVQDAVVAERIVARAVEQGLGTVVEL